METEVKIKQIENGFIISGINPNTDNPVTQVFQYPDCIENTKKYLEIQQEMLYAVLTLLELYGSKHDPARLFINIEEQSQ